MELNKDLKILNHPLWCDVRPHLEQNKKKDQDIEIRGCRIRLFYMASNLTR